MLVELPYGRGAVQAHVPDHLIVETLLPPSAEPATNPEQKVQRALEHPLGEAALPEYGREANDSTVAIAVNDKTRPVPHSVLLPPLLRVLEARGVRRENINLIIATGTHPVMDETEYRDILPDEVVDAYRVLCHDAYDGAQLVHLGDTARGTPCILNRTYAEADYKIVVGNIEPHQFMGFSGGVKSAAIGLAGAETINANHVLMREEASRLGVFDGNPARGDVEQLGAIIGIDLALNAVLTADKRLVDVFAGEPGAVMERGIPRVLELCTVPVDRPYDAMLISPGGHPKDINVYQSQKGLAHAAAASRPDAPFVLVAACPDGSGSKHYEDWVSSRGSHRAVLSDFAAMEFEVGPHKAFQIARDVASRKFRIVTEMDSSVSKRLLLAKADSFQSAVDEIIAPLEPGSRIGVLARANATIPMVG
ncbi:MAG: nickel-dependent lactate racemase [Spirochaetales bacterium]